MQKEIPYVLYTRCPRKEGAHIKNEKFIGIPCIFFRKNINCFKIQLTICFFHVEFPYKWRSHKTSTFDFLDKNSSIFPPIRDQICNWFSSHFWECLMSPNRMFLRLRHMTLWHTANDCKHHTSELVAQIQYFN